MNGGDVGTRTMRGTHRPEPGTRPDYNPTDEYMNAEEELLPRAMGRSLGHLNAAKVSRRKFLSYEPD